MERHVTDDGLVLQVRTEGSGRPILMVHGAMDRSASFLRAARLLLGNPVVLIDRRGYGRSEVRTGAQAPDFLDHVSDLGSILEWVGTWNPRLPLLVGHSLGGAICLVNASQQPTRIAGVLVYEAPLLWEPWWPKSTLPADQPELLGDGAFGERFMRRIVGDRTWEVLPESTKQRRRSEGRILKAELRSARCLSAPALSRIDTPVVVAAGSEVTTHRRRALEFLVDSIPNAEMQLIVGAGHNAHSGRPVEFADLYHELEQRTFGD